MKANENTSNLGNMSSFDSSSENNHKRQTGKNGGKLHYPNSQERIHYGEVQGYSGTIGWIIHD